ncbi:MAG: PAS domain S-box protein [Methanoregula sp.]|jgi:PAS domain S-box-containing protein|nr:PAS domain S-box protein [Methanoregula sp.]
MFSILYVDDEPTLLEIGKLFLEEKGLLSVDTVLSAQKALLKISEKKYDAIISDFQMPEMDGIEFLKRVRTSGNTVPFIIFTGRGREEIVIQAINEGADFYLQKGGEPVSQFAELEHKVQMAVMRRKAEASIRDHERREADIINFLPDATFAVDTKGIVIAWNRAMERMTGVKSSEILGKDNYEYAIPFYHERRPILIDLVLKDDPFTTAKYPAITRDGTTLFSEITIPHFNNGSGAALWFTASPLYDTRGTIVGAIESIREITERKQAEEALHKSEKFLNSVVENIPDMIFVKDAQDLRFVRFNKASEELLGYTREDLYGKSDGDIFPKNEADFFTIKDHEVLNKRQVIDIPEEKIQTRLRGERLLHTKKIPILDELGNPSFILGISEDITERRKAENDLKNTVVFLNSLIDQSPTPMWISNEKGILILINKACCDLFQIDEADVIGKYSIFEDLLVIEQGFLPRVRDVFEKGNVARFQIDYDTQHLKNLNLTKFVSLILEVTIFPVRDASGKITNAVIQHANITERKKAEAALTDSEIRFSSLIQNASDMIRILDSEGKIVYESPSAEAILGYPAGENIGKDALTFVHPDDLERVKSYLREVYDLTNSGTPTELRVRKADGTNIWVETIATNLLHVPAVNGVVITTRPIEHRKKMETALRKSEEQYRTVFETTGTATVLIENDATISLANSEFEHLSGFRKDEIENRKKWTEFVVTEDLDRMLAQHQLRRKNGQSALKHYEFRFRSRSGLVRNIYLTIDVIPGTKKSVASLLDITERKQVEDSLVVANTEYTNLLGQIQDVYYRSDTEGRLVKASHSFVTLLGYDDVSECLGRSIADDFYTNSADRKPFVEEINRKGKVTDYEVLLKKKDGTPVIVEASSHLYYDPAGNIIGLEGTFRDITDRKRAEDELRAAYEQLTASQEELKGQFDELAASEQRIRESEKKFRTLFNNANDAIYIHELFPDGTPGKFLEVNDNMCSRLDYTREELLTMTIRDIVSDAHRQKMPEIGLQIAKTGFHTFYGEHKRKDGSVFPVEINTRRFTLSGKEIVMVAARDITERKRAEEALHESEEKYRTLIEQSRDGFYIIQDGRIVFYNRGAFASMTGYERTEILGKPFIDLIAPEDRGKLMERIRKRQDDPSIPGPFEFNLLYKDGNTRILVQSHASMGIYQGRPALMGSMQNITEDRQREVALKESEARLRRILEQEPLPLCFVNNDGVITLRSDRFVQVFGYTAEDVPDLNAWWQRAYPDPDYRQQVIRSWEDAVMTAAEEHKDIRPAEYRVTCKNGEDRIIEISGITLDDGFLATFIDLTERRKADAALRESEDRFRRLVSSSFDAVIVHQDGKIALSNDRAARILGAASGSELVGKPVISFVHPEFRQRVADRIRQMLQSAEGAAPLIEEKFIRIDGTAIDVEVMAVTTQHEGRPAMMMVFRDITDRKRADEELFNSRQMLQLVLDTIPQRVFWKDRKSVFLGCNTLLALDAGFSDPAEMVGKTDYDHASSSTADLYRADDRQVMESGQSKINFEEPQVRSDGSKAWLLTSKVPLRDKEGKIIGVLGTYDDITARKRAEEKLQESEERYRSLFENNHAVMLLIDPDTGAIIDANPAACTYYRWSRDELVKKRIDEINTLTNAEIQVEMQLASNQKRNHFSFRHRLADGTIHDVEVYSSPIRLGSKPLLYSIIFDITDRKRSEQELKSAYENLTASDEELRARVEELALNRDLLRESEEKFRALVETTSDFIWEVDVAGRYTYVSPKVRDLLGYKLEEMIDKTPFDFMPPDEAQRMAAELTRLVRLRLPISVLENRSIHKNGSIVVLETSGVPRIAKDGTFIGYRGIDRDITDRKMAEEKLREKTDELDQYFSASLDLFCIADTNGFFRRLNPEWERDLGYTLAEMEGHRFLDFVHPDDMQATLSAIADLASQKVVIHFTNRFRHKDGSYRWIEWKSYPKGKRIFAVARDITERKQAEREIRKARDMFRTFVDHSYDAVFISDLNGRVLDVNATMLKMYQVNREEALSLTIDDFSGPASLMRLEDSQKIWNEVLSGKDHILPWQAKRPKDGSLFDVEVYLTRIEIENQPVILANVRDVTDRKRAEEALIESRGQYKKIFESFIDIYYETDKNGIFAVLSPSVYNMSGWKPDELIGKHISILYANPSDRQVLLEKITREQAAYGFEVLLKKRDGTPVPVSVNARIRYNASGEPDGLLGSIQDITENTRTRKALQESETKYRHIIENLQDVYFQTDLDGNLSMVSPSAARIYGYSSADEMIGVPAESLYYNSEQREKMLHILQGQGKIVDFTSEARRKDGTPFWASLNVQFRFDEGGHIQGTEAIVRDVSERKNMEEAIREINRKVSLLNSITRHDVANQVSILRGFAKIAMMKKPDPVVVDLLEKIDATGSVISGQIAFTKAYQELGMHAPGWHRIREIIEQQKSEGISLSSTCNAVVFADPMLEKVFFNLIDNAARHGERVTAIAVSCKPDPDGLVITVEDNGVGVPLDLKEKIFEKGYGKHTGFGLFLAREILAITGITIHETGLHGKGARFEIIVPKGKYRFTS